MRENKDCVFKQVRIKERLCDCERVCVFERVCEWVCVCAIEPQSVVKNVNFKEVNNEWWWSSSTDVSISHNIHLGRGKNLSQKIARMNDFAVRRLRCRRCRRRRCRRRRRRRRLPPFSKNGF